MASIILSEHRLHNLIRECIKTALNEHELDFDKSGTLYAYQHGTTPHQALPNFKPKIKPLIMYKQFKLRLDKKTGENLAKGVVFPLYVNTEDSGNQGTNSQGLKLGVWYKSGEGSCWLNTKNGRSYTRGKGYGTDGQTLDILAYRPGWHLTTTPWGNQRGNKTVKGGKKGTGNNYQYTWDSEVWAKVEICVDVNATEIAKQRAIELKKQEAQSKGYKYQENSYDPKDACLDKMGEDYYYLYKTNSNASDDQAWYIVDKIRIVEILDDDTVDATNDKYYNDLSNKTGRTINSDPQNYTSKKADGTPNTEEIPYWKMPRMNGKRYTKQELIDNGYLPQQLSKGNWQ